MPNREFEQEEEEVMQDTIEKTPGVYVRSNDHPPHELDMLWSGSRGHLKEERPPVISFLLGLILGVLATTAVFMLVINKPKVLPGDPAISSSPIQQIIQQLGLGGDNDASKAESDQKAEGVDEVQGNESAREDSTSGKGAAGLKSRTYTVQSGDTLGTIAEKHYGSSVPALVEKIQRANNMENPNALSLGQELVIPPKE